MLCVQCCVVVWHKDSNHNAVTVSHLHTFLCMQNIHYHCRDLKPTLLKLVQDTVKVLYS